MSDVTLVDGGPLVALLDRSDPHHASCTRAARSIRGALVTVWPAITKAMYLLSSWPDMQGGLLEWLELGSVKLASLEAEDMPRVRELMAKYRDRRIDFADAALVRVAERDKLRRVFTVDKKDFNVYRILKTGRFSILP